MLKLSVWGIRGTVLLKNHRDPRQVAHKPSGTVSRLAVPKQCFECAPRKSHLRAHQGVGRQEPVDWGGAFVTKTMIRHLGHLPGIFCHSIQS